MVGQIFCFKVILLDTFLERLTPLLARTRPMSRIVCFTRSSVPEENKRLRKRSVGKFNHHIHFPVN